MVPHPTDERVGRSGALRALALAAVVLAGSVLGVVAAATAAAGDGGGPTRGASSPPPDAGPAATAGAEPAVPQGAEPARDRRTDDCAGLVDSPRPDPSNDTLGWENGCWANATLEVARSDGLDAAERRAVLSRAMARVESIRRLEFRRDVTLDLEDSFGGGGGRRIPRRNLKYEALLFLGENESYADAVGASSPPGYADGGDRLVRIVADGERPTLPAHFLAHELAHTLQHQHLREDAPRRLLGLTIDERAAASAPVEGGAQYVQHRYERRCLTDWECGALDRENFTDVHPGLFGLTAFPYMDGMAFVHRIREAGGWSAVNDLYRTPPASSEQVIHPGAYPDDAPETGEMRVGHRSATAWQPVELLGGKRYESAGEVGVFLLFAYATWDPATDGVAVDRKPFRNAHDTRPAPFDPYDYAHPWSEGWAGDRMVFYNDLGTDLNETGYVWKLRWETPADAREFLRGYRRVLELRGAREVSGAADTWRIPDDRRFGDAFYLDRNGSTVVVVNAPTVEALPRVRERGWPGRETPTTSTTTRGSPSTTTASTQSTAEDATPTGATPTTDGSTTGSGSTGAGVPTTSRIPPDHSSEGAPGFTVVAAVLAVALVAALARRRRR